MRFGTRSCTVAFIATFMIGVAKLMKVEQYQRNSNAGRECRQRARQCQQRQDREQQAFAARPLHRRGVGEKSARDITAAAGDQQHQAHASPRNRSAWRLIAAGEKHRRPDRDANERDIVQAEARIKRHHDATLRPQKAEVLAQWRDVRERRDLRAMPRVAVRCTVSSNSPTNGPNMPHRKNAVRQGDNEPKPGTVELKFGADDPARNNGRQRRAESRADQIGADGAPAPLRREHVGNQRDRGRRDRRLAQPHQRAKDEERLETAGKPTGRGRPDSTE